MKKEFLSLGRDADEAAMAIKRETLPKSVLDAFRRLLSKKRVKTMSSEENLRSQEPLEP